MNFSVSRENKTNFIKQEHDVMVIWMRRNLNVELHISKLILEVNQGFFPYVQLQIRDDNLLYQIIAIFSDQSWGVDVENISELLSFSFHRIILAYLFY